MGEHGHSARGHDGAIAYQVESPGFFEVGDEHEFSRSDGGFIGGVFHPEDVEDVRKPSDNPKPYDGAGYDSYNDKKFQFPGLLYKGFWPKAKYKTFSVFL
jgi:hypothetical protein